MEITFLFSELKRQWGEGWWLEKNYKSEKQNKIKNQKHSLHMFGLLIKSAFTHCISYFPDAIINQHNQKQCKKGFILP